MIFCKNTHPSFVKRTLYVVPTNNYPFCWNNLTTIVSYTEGKFLKPSVYQWTISYSDYQRIVVLAEGIAGSEPAAFQVIRETIDELKRDFKLLHGKE